MECGPLTSNFNCLTYPDTGLTDTPLGMQPTRLVEYVWVSTVGGSREQTTTAAGQSAKVRKCEKHGVYELRHDNDSTTRIHQSSSVTPTTPKSQS